VSDPIPVIDLFAGPGGLNEGFSQLDDSDGNAAFSTVASFEMDSIAVKTLKLREAFRHLKRSEEGVPDSYYSFIRGELSWEAFAADPLVAEALAIAEHHVHEVELGSDEDSSDVLIRAALDEVDATNEKPWALIGGPPCQAYSLAGRSRRANDDTFAEDKKHFLYREYLRIIRDFQPSVFVMENVKGLLSSTTTGVGMFELIKNDLTNPGEDLHYDIYSLTSDKAPEELDPRDFIIKSEQYGIPQKRHRVILLGVKRGFLQAHNTVGTLSRADTVTVDVALSGIPALRSGISPARLDNDDDWFAIRADASKGATSSVRELGRGTGAAAREGIPTNPQYAGWIIDDRLDAVVQHQTRSHMVEDLKRYWFAADSALRHGTSPRLSGFPKELQPNHKNATAETRPFEDRFRVQIGTGTASTIVSHISKDGNYYIHPDPDQMRSLTVREAARLQTFPDNYFFMGNRTQQYHQVGNAVPPLLANKVAKIVRSIFTAAAGAESPLAN
jgi:DNA (cytosine-5)-methyltransferase 1